MAKTSAQKIAAANAAAVQNLVYILLCSLALSFGPRFHLPMRLCANGFCRICYQTVSTIKFMALSGINVVLFAYIYWISRPVRDPVTGKIVYEGTDLSSAGLTEYAYDTRTFEPHPLILPFP